MKEIPVKQYHKMKERYPQLLDAVEAQGLLSPKQAPWVRTQDSSCSWRPRPRYALRVQCTATRAAPSRPGQVRRRFATKSCY